MRVQVVSFHCVLKNNLGEFISSSFNQDVVTTESESEVPMLPDLVAALRLLKKGDRKKISLKAEKAYGLYRPELLVTVLKRDLVGSSTLKTGSIIRTRLPKDQTMRTYRVVSLTKTEVTLDANHELAGQDLIFDVEMVSSHEENEHPRHTPLGLH